MTIDEPTQTDELRQPRSVRTAGFFIAASVGLASLLLITALVLTTDPGDAPTRLFLLLALCAASGFGSAIVLFCSGRGDSPLADVLRAYRRGILVGLACSGAAVLELNAAFTAPNLVFLMLVLLIIEMIFVARRQEDVA